jgi:hypothetical protein
MNSILARCAAALWMVAALAGPALADTVSLEPGMDRMGGDYKNFTVNQADPAVCRKACADDATCKAYTFVKPGIKGPTAVCFLKSAAAPASANACCTSGVKSAGGLIVLTPTKQPGGPIVVQMPPTGNPGQTIAAPTNVRVELDPDQNGLAWTWGTQGCFPGAAGKAPVECQYIKDIEGFKVYDGTGKLVRTLTNPAAKNTMIGKASTGCYTVRAYKGALESANSEQVCVEGSDKSKYQSSNAIPAPFDLRATFGMAQCAASAQGVLTASACDAALKANYQPLVWGWSGSPGQIDGFRLYDKYNGKPIEVADKTNAKLRMFMVEPLKGVQINSYCFTVRAYKGITESPSSNEVCIKPLPPVPPPLPPTPTNLHLTKNVTECATAAGSPLLAFVCDAAIKANGQVLVFDAKGDGIEGYRLYDSYGGAQVLQESKFHADQRMFIIPALTGIKINDYCFKVRSVGADAESLPSNTVCVDPLKPVPPPAPPKNVTILAPVGGTIVSAVETRKNFNSGCPFTERLTKLRTKGKFDGSLSAMYIHRDTNILCGKRALIWTEGSAEFALNEVPAKFNKATLKFISSGTLAKVGTEGGFLNVFGNKVTLNSVNCVREIYSYNIGIHDNSAGGGTYEKMGDPLAWFSYHKTGTVATATNTTPGGANAFDVTAIVRQSIKTKQKKQGFNFAVEQGMLGDNDMCTAGFSEFTLELE